MQTLPYINDNEDITSKSINLIIVSKSFTLRFENMRWTRNRDGKITGNHRIVRTGCEERDIFFMFPVLSL